MVRRSLHKKETHTDFPVFADVEEAGAPVPTSRNNGCDCGPATGSADRLLHHGTGWYRVPGESRVVNLTKMQNGSH